MTLCTSDTRLIVLERSSPSMHLHIQCPTTHERSALLNAIQACLLPAEAKTDQTTEAAFERGTAFIPAKPRSSMAACFSQKSLAISSTVAEFLSTAEAQAKFRSMPEVVGAIRKAPCFMATDAFSQLSLPSCLLDGRGLECITEAIRWNCSLIIIDLSKCGIKLSPFKELAKVLEAHPALCNLHLSLNPLGSGSGRVLASLLKASKTLAQLHVSSTQLGKGAIDVLNAVAGSTLALLNLSNNGVDISAEPAVCDLLRQNKSRLRQLDLSRNLLNVSSAVAIAGSLASNDTIAELNLLQNPITSTAPLQFTLSSRKFPVDLLVCDRKLQLGPRSSTFDTGERQYVFKEVKHGLEFGSNSAGFASIFKVIPGSEADSVLRVSKSSVICEINGADVRKLEFSKTMAILKEIDARPLTLVLQLPKVDTLEATSTSDVNAAALTTRSQKASVADAADEKRTTVAHEDPYLSFLVVFCPMGQDGSLSPQDKERIWTYREDKKITDDAHSTALDKLDWTKREFDVGVRKRNVKDAAAALQRIEKATQDTRSLAIATINDIVALPALIAGTAQSSQVLSPLVSLVLSSVFNSQSNAG